MTDELRGKRIAILATDGVEQVELEQPRQAVEDAGAGAELLSLDDGEIQAMNSDLEPADSFAVDRQVADASLDEYDGLILRNAGAETADEEVVIDDNIITSRKPDGLPAFCDAVVRELSAVHAS